MNIDKRALREVAEKATKGPWKVFSDIDTKTFSIHTPRDKRCENVIKWGRFDCQPNAEANAEFIAAFNPKVALALLDENIQLQREKDAIEAVALALRDDMRQAREQLEEAEKRNAEQQRNLDHHKFLLSSACEVQRDFAEALGCAGDNESIMEAIDDMKQRIAELEARTVPIVPDEITSASAPEVFEITAEAERLGLCGTYASYAVGWNACRAAMLQGAEPVSQTYKLNELSGNSPVTPNGWISCSERMPNDKQYVWCWGKSYGWTECDTFEGYYDWSRNKWWAVTDDGEEPASKVTHWMPLPEPPQEVNRG